MCRLRPRASSSATVVGARETAREARARDPEDLRLARRGEMPLLERDLLVGRSRLAVEDERRIVGRIHRGDRQRRAQRRVRADEARVDAEALERIAHVRCRTSSSPTAVTTALLRPRRAAATATFVGLPPIDFANVRASASDAPVLLRVEVDAQLARSSGPRARSSDPRRRSSSCVSASSSAPPAISRTSCSRVDLALRVVADAPGRG